MECLRAVMAGAGFLVACSSTSVGGTTTDGGNSPDGSASDGGSKEEAGGGPAITGTLRGQPVHLTDQVGLFEKAEPDSGITSSYAAAFLTDQAGTCGLFHQKVNPANSKALSFIVSGKDAVVNPGTYAVTAPGSGSGTQANVGYVENDAVCTKTGNGYAQSGTLTLTTVTPTTIAGTFDATFAGGDRVTGSFSAPVCDVQLRDLVGSTCK